MTLEPRAWWHQADPPRLPRKALHRETGGSESWGPTTSVVAQTPGTQNTGGKRLVQLSARAAHTGAPSASPNPWFHVQRGRGSKHALTTTRQGSQAPARGAGGPQGSMASGRGEVVLRAVQRGQLEGQWRRRVLQRQKTSGPVSLWNPSLGDPRVPFEA